MNITIFQIHEKVKELHSLAILEGNRPKSGPPEPSRFSFSTASLMIEWHIQLNIGSAGWSLWRHFKYPKSSSCPTVPYYWFSYWVFKSQTLGHPLSSILYWVTYSADVGYFIVALWPDTWLKDKTDAFVVTYTLVDHWIIQDLGHLNSTLCWCSRCLNFVFQLISAPHVPKFIFHLIVGRTNWVI